MSLAARERGLKLCKVERLALKCPSLAARERGLKQNGDGLRVPPACKSLAARERGLKPELLRIRSEIKAQGRSPRASVG